MNPAGSADGIRFSGSELAEVIENILLARQFEIERKDLVWTALTDFKASRTDFADCLIGLTNALAGALPRWWVAGA